MGKECYLSVYVIVYSSCILVCSVTDRSVMSFLSAAGKERWKGRGSVKTIVLVDDHSTMDSLVSAGDGESPLPLLALRDALYKVRP